MFRVPNDFPSTITVYSYILSPAVLFYVFFEKILGLGPDDSVSTISSIPTACPKAVNYIFIT